LIVLPHIQRRKNARRRENRRAKELRKERELRLEGSLVPPDIQEAQQNIQRLDNKWGGDSGATKERSRWDKRLRDAKQALKSVIR
jgi:hypothetical protein